MKGKANDFIKALLFGIFMLVWIPVVVVFIALFRLGDWISVKWRTRRREK